MRIVSLVNCQSGGIGRHVGFKIQCSLGVWVRVPPLVRESAVTYVTVGFSFTTSQLKFIKSSPKTNVRAMILYQFKDTNCVKVSFLSIPLNNFVWVGAK